jgi:hypothetical protein
MIQIEPYRPQHRRELEAFVAAIQEVERALVPELRPGATLRQIMPNGFCA